MGENRSLSNGQEGNVPKLRFPGFEGEWTSKQFGDIFSFLPNNTLSRAELVTDGEVLNIHYGDILTKYTSILNAEYDEIPSIVLGKESKGCSYLQDGDIVIADTAEDETAGKALEIININGRKIESGLHTIPCHPNYSYAPMYLGYYINSAHFHKQLIPLMQGIKVLSVSKSNISKTIISAPNTICEQEKTAFILHLLDCRIKKQQQVIETLKKYKRGLLSSMFPEKGEAIPKHRFSGFTEPWEQRKLGKIAGNVIGGGTPKTSVAEYWDGSIPWIQSSNVQENEMFEFEIPKSITQLGLDKSAAKLIPQNSIAIVTHVGVGKLVFVPFPYATSQDFTSLAELKTDAKFTCYSLYRRIQNDLHIVQGSAIKGITKEDLLTKEIMVPEIEEQKKIGEYFRRFDRLITLHQCKLDISVKIKSGLLQQLFI